MLDLVAKKLFLTKGVGVADDKLTSFEFALRNAGIAGTNIVLISSIFPPNAKLLSRKDGLKMIKPGQILFTIYSRNQTNEPQRLISSSVGVAQPKDRTKYGYLSEYEAFGKSEKEAGDYAEDGQIYKTKNITQTAKGDKDGKWTTVFAAAVLII